VANRSVTTLRREKIQQFIRKGVETPSALAQVTGFTLAVIKHDLIFFRNESKKWQSEQAQNGYIWALENAENQIQDLIEEQQQKRTTKEVKADPKELRETVRLIADLMALKFQIKTSAPAIASIQRMLEKANETRK